MANRRDCSRRGWLQVCSAVGVGIGSVAGCLRLEEEEEEAAEATGTGEDSQGDTESAPSSLLMVSSTTGIVGPEQTIHELQVAVQRSPGGGDIDLSDVVIELLYDGDAATLQAAQDSDAEPAGEDALSDPGEAFGVAVVTAERTDDLVLSDDADRYELLIQTDGTDLPSLAEGTEAELSFTTGTGTQTQAVVAVPDTLGEQEAGDTVGL